MNFLNGAMGEKRYELNGDSGRGITIACVGVLVEEHDEGPKTAVGIRETGRRHAVFIQER